jgi:hypothetical protein
MERSATRTAIGSSSQVLTAHAMPITRKVDRKGTISFASVRYKAGASRSSAMAASCSCIIAVS